MDIKNWTVIQVPYGGGYSSLNLSYVPNTRRAPEALKKEFMRQKIFIADNGISSWDNVAWYEMNFGFGCKNNIDGWEKMYKSVRSHLKVLDWKPNTNTNVLFLGGSHSITAATYLSMITKFGWRKTGLIVLDAHPDCCHKANWPIHSDWLRWLVENEYVLSKNILIVGLRQTEKSEKEFLEKRDIARYSMSSLKNIDDFTMNNILALFVLERLRKLEATYLSIDIDVASGAYAPGTGCPSPGGFTDKELINLVKQFKIALPNLKAVDIVEINPLKWWQKRVLRYDATVDLGVKLVKEIIS